MAFEYTNELNQNYLAQLLNPIEERGVTDESRARAEGKAGGLGFQAAMGSEIGLARQGTARAKSDTIGKFNMDVAGMKREERLTGEKRAYDSLEAQKQRDEQEKLTRMGFEFQDQQREARRKSDSAFNGAGFATGLVSSAVSAGVGGYFGGLGKAAGAAAAPDPSYRGSGSER